MDVINEFDCVILFGCMFGLWGFYVVVVMFIFFVVVVYLFGLFVFIVLFVGFVFVWGYSVLFFWFK